MSRNIFNAIMIAVLVCGISACTNKGKLKSPSQIAYEEQKKARKDEKKGLQSVPELKDNSPAEEDTDDTK